ncbi:protein OS-9 isoform X2 [Engraulis encrasicolus]|uniref:protein OS-9 isoform X2 n=1 Tax=Engraulis encrasicolus TaxID=184585 RepID=UPI002FD798D5
MAAPMVRWLRGLYVFFLTCLLPVGAFLNLEELNEMKYGIQILSDPVIMGQEQSEDVMLVSNKYKQRYECRLPAQALLFQPHSPNEAPSSGSGSSYSGPSIPEMLEPMGTSPCLVKTKDWWTYEFCYGKYIRQYHLEDSEIKGDVLFLGYYGSEFDWTNDTAKASKQHRLRRFHSQSYINGSKCDLNGNPRETEVRFACEEGSVDYIVRVDEPQSCRYVVTIHTSRPCAHPLLRPPPSTRPQPIVCQPALSAGQYMDYVKAQVSDTKRKVEQISEELKTLDEILSKDEGADDDSEKTEEALEEADTQAAESVVEENNNILESVVKTAEQRAEAEAEAAAEQAVEQVQDNEVFGEEKFNFRIISDPADLMKFVQHLRESSKKKSESEEEEEEEEQRVSKKKKKEVKKEGVGKAKEEDDDDEAAVDDDEEDDDDEGLFQEFEQEIADLSIPEEKRKEIKEEMQKEFSNIIDEAQQELESEGLKGEFDRSQATHTLENTLDKLLDRLQDKGDEEEQTPNTHTPTPPHTQTHTPTEEDADTTPVDHNTAAEGKGKREKPSDAASRASKHPGKIEVKILSRKTVEEAGDQWLSEEDTKSFRELLINLLTGGTEEVYKEQKRQQELEDNYKFVWGGEQPDESQSVSSTDGQTTVVTDTDDLEL